MQSTPSLDSNLSIPFSFLSQLISQKLDHSNYLSWKKKFVPFIRSHDLYGHLDGSMPAPPQVILREIKDAKGDIIIQTEKNPEFVQWMRCDQTLVAYISSILSVEVLLHIDDDISAAELWKMLGDTYSHVPESRVWQLQREFHNLKRGSQSIMQYLAQMKGITDQLAMIGHGVSDRDKVYQALIGLGPEYDVFCTVLKVLPSLPSFEELKAKLILYEINWVHAHDEVDSYHNVSVTNIAGKCRSLPNFAGKGIIPTPIHGNVGQRRVPICFYCNKRGHVKSDCWHNPQNKGKQHLPASRVDKKLVGDAPQDVHHILTNALSKMSLKQNQDGQWYLDSGLSNTCQH